MIPKVLAYIIQYNQILTFRHRDYPEAGIQVPAGTVDPGESPEEAVLREVREESGIKGLHIQEKIGVYSYFHEQKKEWQERHVFVLISNNSLPEQWTHTVSSGTDDKGLVFEYEWIPIAEKDHLESSQGVYFKGTQD